ncbi:Ig-like domain repeat protein [Candidatus Aerophobetes bacterium]|nr:Ig-like domain repeat protein [Candidatus Aerophobetes bacterium]
MNEKTKVLKFFLVGFLVILGFSGNVWAAVQEIQTFGLVESLSAASATLTSNFNKGSVVYVRVKDTTTGVSSDATVQDVTHPTNQITFKVYDDGTFPDDNPDDGYYWGRFTIVDGDYTFTDDTEDTLGLASGETATITCDGISHTITALFSQPDHEKPTIGTFDVNPNPFSPNGDGIQDTTSISYSLSDNQSQTLWVRVEIRNESGKIVKTLADAESKQTGALYTCSWDGRDLNNNPVPDGNYTCRIIALDEAGNSREETFVITVDTTPPQIMDISLSPNPFSPNNDGVKDTVTVSFTLSGAATGGNRVEIRDTSGVLVRTLDDEISPSGGGNGENSVSWDGKDDTGSPVPDGTYYCEIWAVDSAGNISLSRGVVRVDKTFPSTAIQVLSNPPTSASAHVSPFDISDIGTSSPTGLYISDVQENGEWQTSDESGIQSVQIIIEGDSYNASFTPQNPSGTWQGWYLYWTPPVSDGVYTILVRAIDNAGNDSGASGAFTTIVYDNSPPTSQISSPPDGAKFATYPITISGVAGDGDSGSGVKSVQIRITKLASPPTVIASFDTTFATDTSSGGDFSTWEYLFTPDEPSSPASYLIECRAIDNLYDPTSPTSSSHIQASPDSVIIIYDTQSSPYHPTDIKDDGVLLSAGHYFGLNNLLTCNQIYFSGLEGVRFEYRVEPSGQWQTIGFSPYTATPPASYVAEVLWNTEGLSSDVTYSFRAVAVSAEGDIPSETYSGCYIDNSEVNLVSSIAEASLDFGGEKVCDMTSSTQYDFCSSFFNGKIDTIYVKANLYQGFSVDTSSSFISLEKILSIRTGSVETESVEGSSQISYNSGENSVEFYFYPEQVFDPEKYSHEKDGFYQVKIGVADSSGNLQELSLFFVYDTTPPSPPDFSVQSFETGTGVVSLSGATLPESSEPQWVQVYINGVSKATCEAEEDRSFTVQVKLNPGKNSISLRAKDRAGNEGEFTSPLNITYNPQKLLSVILRSSRILRRGSELSPVKLVFYLTESARVNIKIYNLLGEIVYEWEGEIAPGSEEEWCWWGENMFGEKVNNGVYIMKVEVKSSTRKEVVTKLVGVLR